METMSLIAKIHGLIEARRISDAEALALTASKDHPDVADVWVQLGRIAQMKGDASCQLSCAQTILALDPDHLIGHYQQCEALMALADVSAVKECLKAFRRAAERDANFLQHVGQFYNQLGDYGQALAAYKAAVALAPNDPEALYNLSTALSFRGDAAGAEAALDKVIALNPNDFDAYYNRSTLRKQTPDSNHITELSSLLPRVQQNKGAVVQVAYALAKEHEDLGHMKTAFSHLKTGADARRAMLQYGVADDRDTMQQIAAAMDADFCAGAEVLEGDGPIFILGLPRTGSTLVDRILSSHSKVDSLGEINDFAVAMMQASGKATGKADLINKSTRADFKGLGDMYRASTTARGKSSPCLIDKTLNNFLYIGLIARALPNAKIIHLSRNPMDTCFAIYKTLFRMGYPYSYDLSDLAQYYAAYHTMMAHWRTVLPGRIIDVSYEVLVAHQETATRKLLSACGLDFEDACLAFHKNQSATATASAAQVREKIYSTSIGKWQTLETELSPLRDQLKALGIAV